MPINEVLSIGVDFSRYAGKWVVVCDNRIIAHNKNLNNLQGEIKQSKTIPIIVKIPKRHTLIF